MTVVLILLGIAAHLWALWVVATGNFGWPDLARALFFACMGMILIGVAQ